MFSEFALAALIVCICGSESASLRADSQLIVDDSQGLGRVFDGIGGLSGGGATSKLLVNYPKEQLGQILDFLFKPNFGASLQILKVEIGGDVQSTDGTEASHMHNSWDENYERGYEWWLMKEAKKRNPFIKLYGLPWGFPGWIGQGTRSPYTNINITADYVVRWVNGAKTHHNLTIDYVGIWNERSYDVNYIKKLRSLLDERGFQHTQVIAADIKWNIAKDIAAQPDLAKAVYAIGCHYPGTKSTELAQSTGKPLWSSEDFSTFNDQVGGGCWARILNWNYVNGYMTSTISWNLIASYYKELPYYRDGLMTAVQPWTGNYVVESPIWLAAHTTQFTKIGWRYLKHGFGVSMLEKGGTSVALVSPSGDQLTIVMESMTHNHSLCIRPPLPKYNVEPQVVNITLKGKFANITEMNVWYSKLGFDGAEPVMFEKRGMIKFVNGSAQVSMGLDEVYTLTTISTGQKGQYPEPPAPKPFPLPYKDDFEAYSQAQEPFSLSPQIGSLEVAISQNASHHMIVRQSVLDSPLNWCPIFFLSFPIAVLGDYNWTDIFIEIDFEIPQINGTDGVFLAARVDAGGCQAFLAHGVFLFIMQDKYIVAHDLARTKVLKSGSLSIKPGEWHQMSLLVKGNMAMGAMDKQQLFNVTVPTSPVNGFAGIGTDTYGLADFDNIYVDTAQEGIKKMLSYSSMNVLYFDSEHP